MTALSCANKVYDKLHYFSYISNVDESVDAYAAKEILAHLGLEHELYEIPENWDGYKDLPVFKKVMECNNGWDADGIIINIIKRNFLNIRMQVIGEQCTKFMLVNI